MYNRNKRVISKVLSIILVITMILTGGMLNVFADFANKLMPLVENTSTIAEDESLREEYTKHFKMPDGSYSAISYTAPVHRKDANGNWVDIDNRMEETISKNKQAYVTSDGRMTFSKKINGSDNVVFNLSENGYGVKVSFNENDIKNTTAKLSNHAKKYVPSDSDSIPEQYKKVKVIDNNTTIQYKNLIKGMTLEYVLSSNDIKENIIINEKQERYNYSFVYEFTGGLGAVLNDDGTVSLRDQKTDTDVYILPAPYMFDAEGNISENVEYQLTDLGNDKYSLNVIADSSWINDSERAWPVVIDPTMSWVAGYYDTYLDSAHPDDNFGSSRELWVSSSRTTIMNHTFLPTIDDDVTINRATLNLSYYYNVSSGNVDVGLYQVTTSWKEQEVTWNSMSNFANGGISTVCRGTTILQASSTINASSPGSAAINITELVKDWYAGIPNYGVALKYRGGTNLSVILMSWETGNATRAKFEVSYSTGGLPVSNGTYYFNNSQYGKYMQIDDDQSTSTNGAILELWDYADASNQKWTLEYLHNGYYKIVSGASGKVVTAPSAEDGSLTQKNYNVSDNQLWKITSVAGGMYKLSPKSHSSYYMAAGDGVFSSDGRNVEMRSAQSDSKDKWYLYLLDEHTINVDVIYDDAYNNRYSGAKSRIKNQMLVLKEKYLREFGITVNYQNVNLFYSYADLNCTVSHTGKCDHVDNSACKNSSQYPDESPRLESYHHTNIYNIVLRIPFPDLNDSVKVAYIGQEYCTQNNHSGHPYNGMTYPKIGLAAIMNFGTVKSETQTLIHEFGHLYDVRDHYGEGCPTTAQLIAVTGNTNFSQNCIYGENRGTSSVTNNYTICEGCKATIRDNINSYNH